MEVIRGQLEVNREMVKEVKGITGVANFFMGAVIGSVIAGVVGGAIRLRRWIRRRA
jgi:hypothetical protein